MLYRKLAGHGVGSHVFQPRRHLASAYSRAMFAGAQVHGYVGLAEALVNLRHVLRDREERGYAFLYVDTIDAVGHQYGPDAEQTDAQTDAVLDLLERWLMGPGAEKDVLYILAADHGMTECDPARTVYLNRAARLRGGERFHRRNGAGRYLVPGGSCRDMFLYLREGCLDEARAFFARGLEGQAQVHRVDELARRGYFGPGPLCPQFRGRAGDLVILPYRNESVWWYEPDRFEQTKPGYHGGLTRSEMEIPLLLWRG